MPTTLTRRRALGYRPATYAPRHRVVAALLAAGFDRASVSALTGYSLTHVSRIAGMKSCKHEIAMRLAKSTLRAIAESVRQLAADQSTKI